MKRQFFFLLLCCSVIISSCGGGGESIEDTSPYVLLISFDGFKHDYVEKFNAPNFKKFINNGASAEAMIPSYPSKTFPNHYSVVTGLYPGNHGLVDNTFFDPERETIYRISDRSRVEDAYYYGGLPLWQLVQQNGMKSASYFWVGSEAPIAGEFPSYYHIFDSKVPNESRISSVFDWLNLPQSERPRFVTLYFSFVDTQGHATGPNAAETGNAVLEADRLLGILMAQIEASPLDINVILTSDHGMVELKRTPETFIFTNDMFEGLDLSEVRLLNNGTHAHLFLDNPQLADEIMQVVKARENHFSIYRKEDTPAEWHYRDSDRVGDLFIVVEPGYDLTSREREASRPERPEVWGNHGFDPYVTDDLGAIFYANGPQIQQGVRLPKFENIHVYPLIAEILGIRQLPDIDGDINVLQSILKD